MKKNNDKSSGNSAPAGRPDPVELQELFNNITCAVAVYQAVDDGRDFIFADFNQTAEQIDNVKKEDILGKSVTEVFPGVKEFGLFDVLQLVWKTGQPQHFPVSLYQDGRISGWRENYVYKSSSGHVVAVYNDLAERKRSELAQRISDQCFRAVADYTYDWEIWVGPAGRPLWTNPAVLRSTGYSPKELLAMPDFPMPLIHPEDRERMARAFHSAVKGSTGKGVQFRLVRKDGSIIWVEVNWQPLYDDKGASQGHRTSVRDITDRKNAEQALQRANHALKILSECNQVLIRATNEQDLLNSICRIIVEVGKYRLAWVGLAEYDENKTVRPVAQAGLDEGYLEKLNVTWADTERGRGPTGTAIRTGKPSINRDLAANPDFAPWSEEAAKRGYAASISLPLVTQEHVLGAINIYSSEPDAFYTDEVNLLDELACDLAFGIKTIRTRQERKLAEEQLHLRNRAIEAATNAIVITEIKPPNNPIIYANSAFERITGYSLNEVLGHDCRFLQGTDTNQPACQEIHAAFSEQRSCQVIIRNYKKDGTLFWNEFTVSPVRNKEGQLTHFVGIMNDITDRINAQQALRQSQQMLQLVLDTIPVRVFWKDRNSVFLGCNRPFAIDAGLSSPEEVVGKNDLQLGWAKEAPMYRADDQQVIQSGIPKLNYEEPQTTPDGREIWLRTSKIPLRDTNNEIVGVMGTYEEITERKRSEEKLREAEVRYRTIANFTYDWEYWETPDGALRFVSPSCLRITGYQAEQFIQNPNLMHEIVLPEDKPKWDEFHRRALEVYGPGETQFRILRQDGQIRWIDHACRPVIDDNGDFLGYRGSNRDITDRIQVRQELDRERNLLRTVVDTLPDRIFIKDINSAFVFANITCAEKFGVKSPQDLIGKTDFDFLPKERAQKWFDEEQEIIRSGNGLVNHEACIKDQDGKIIRWLSVTKIPWRDNLGRIIGIVGLTRDITGKKDS
jgi:PAS domain S-box-containing protein